MVKLSVLCLVTLSSSVWMSSALEVCADPANGDPEAMVEMVGMPCGTVANMIMGTIKSADFLDDPAKCKEIPDLLKNMGRTETFEMIGSLAGPICCKGFMGMCDPRRFNPPAEDGERGPPLKMCWPPEAAAPAGTIFTYQETEVECSKANEMLGEDWEASVDACEETMDNPEAKEGDPAIPVGMAMIAMESTCCPYCTNACNPGLLRGEDMSSFLPTCGAGGGGGGEAPATEAPATEAPATEAPATEAPATEAPATEAPGPVKVTGEVEISLPTEMADSLIEDPKVAKKVIEKALQKSMKTDTVTVTKIMVDGEALDMGRRLTAHGQKAITAEWEVTGVSEEGVKTWSSGAATEESGFSQDLIDTAAEESMTIAKVTTKATVKEVEADTSSVTTKAPAPAGGEEAAWAWRQALPSSTALVALLWATSS